MTAGPPADSGASSEGSWHTLRRGLMLSPELKVGLSVTVVLALLATGGRVVVPVALQQVIDRGVADGALDLRVALGLGASALLAVVATAAASYAMNARLARVTETSLANLRVRAFRHLHDLSALTLAAEQRGALVARVTDDIDTISRFMQWGGVMLLINSGQLVVASVVMALYSPELTLLVLATFVPLVLTLRWFSRRLRHAYAGVRVRVGAMLGALAESVVGVEVIRAYAVEGRTRARVDGTIEDHRHAAYSAVKVGALMFASGEVFASVATAGVVVAGVLLGVGERLTVGALLSFLFLTTLFVGPVQVVTEVLDQAQTAVAGWRRVLDLLERVPDVRDPAAAPGNRARDLPPGPVEVRFAGVRFAYPLRRAPQGAGLEAAAPTAAEAPLVLRDVDLVIAPRTRLAVVGETGSGKSTFAALLTRLVDPLAGSITLNDVSIADLRFASLRRAVLLVPQDGFLFDQTVRGNVALGAQRLGDTGAEGLDDAALTRAFADLGLADWLAGLPAGLDTPVGERGTALSAGERQLVALARAFVANPELLVLDEATSAVDPATEARLARALDRLTAGRTSVTIAHRLSTAEAADEIVVFHAGRVVQRGTHAQLVRAEGVYAELHASWAAGAAREPLRDVMPGQTNW